MSEITPWPNAFTASRDEELFAGAYVKLQRVARERMAAEKQGQALDGDGLVQEPKLRPQMSTQDAQPTDHIPPFPTIAIRWLNSS